MTARPAGRRWESVDDDSREDSARYAQPQRAAYIVGAQRAAQQASEGWSDAESVSE